MFPWYVKYPYQNDEVLNLDWVLNTINNLVKEVSDFVVLNTIKYADPIQWNITTQYEKNTVVIDPVTGTAYLSVKPVPSGVGLNNEDYWTVIFTMDIMSANKNITLRDDANNIIATFESEIGDWLLWQGSLYVVTRNIEIGNAYVEDYNIERATVEYFIKLYIDNLKIYTDTIIGDLDNLTTEDKTSLVNAINELVTVIGSLSSLTTTDKDSIVDAINELVTTIGSLSSLTTTNKDSIVLAINELVTTIGSLNSLTTEDKDSIVDAINELVTNQGDLDNLNTEDKTSLVNAVNEVLEDAGEVLLSGAYVTPEMYGAIGDGSTDDTDSLEAALATGKVLVLVSTYKITRPLNPTNHIIGGTATAKIYNPTDSRCIRVGADNIMIANFIIEGCMNDIPVAQQSEYAHGIDIWGNNVLVDHMTIINTGGDGIYIGGNGRASGTIVRGCTIDNNGRNCISVIDAKFFTIKDCILSNAKYKSPMAGIDFEPNQPTQTLIGLVENVTIQDCTQFGLDLALFNTNSNSYEDITFKHIYIKDCGSSGSYPAGVKIYELAESPKCTFHFDDVLIDGAAGSYGAMMIMARSDHASNIITRNLRCINNTAAQAGIYVYIQQLSSGTPSRIDTYDFEVEVDSSFSYSLYGQRQANPTYRGLKIPLKTNKPWYVGTQTTSLVYLNNDINNPVYTGGIDSAGNLVNYNVYDFTTNFDNATKVWTFTFDSKFTKVNCQATPINKDEQVVVSSNANVCTIAGFNSSGTAALIPFEFCITCSI